MAVEFETLQRIGRLMPLADVRAAVRAGVSPVRTRTQASGEAFGRALAVDVALSRELPAAPVALIDGYAVASEHMADANSYAPAALPHVPPRIAAGETLPAGTDAVAPADAIAVRDGRAEAVAAVTAGDGVLAAGADARSDTVLRRAGERLRARDLAALHAAGIGEVQVRAPRIAVVSARDQADRIVDAAVAFIVRAVNAAGGEVSGAGAGNLEAVLHDADTDAVIVVGGTGSGPRDKSVHMLARAGRVVAHGIAIAPGETAAFGFAGARPVIVAPGRLDAAMAVWLLIGAPLIARLADASEDNTATRATLARKVVSSLGLIEVVPVSLRDDKAEPLASGYWPLGAIARADGWIEVAAESEGYPAGAEVVVRVIS